MTATALSRADLGTVPERLAELLGARPNVDLPVEPLVAEPEPPRRVAAVDGSSVVLGDARAFILGAYRAGVVRLEGGRLAGVDVAGAEVALLEKGSAGDAVRRRLAELEVARPAIDDKCPPEVALGHLRGIAEVVAARRALDALSEGDLLLVDGPLRVREPDAPRALVEDLTTTARDRGVSLVGVCKSTSQTVGGFPALAVAQRAARARGLATWAAELPRPDRGSVARPIAARLSGAEPRVFRFDVSALDPEPMRTLARVAALAGHPAYPGYPSPLAMAHNAVLLDEAAERELALAARRAAEDAGADPALWDLAFGDYHDVLDLGA